MVKKIIQVALLVLVGCGTIYGLYLVIVTGPGSGRDSVGNSVSRSTDIAKTQFDAATLRLDYDKMEGKITDSQYAMGLVDQKAKLGYRERVAKDPVSGICQSEMRTKGNVVFEYPLPTVCSDGFEFPVWRDDPHKIVKAEWVTPGGDTIIGSPKLFARRGSTAKDLGDNRWEVEGEVYYSHKQHGGDIILRVSVEQ